MIEIVEELSELMTYNNAILYCQFLEYRGHNDWRMPTKEECDDYHIISWCRTIIQFDRDDGDWAIVPVRDI